MRNPEPLPANSPKSICDAPTVLLPPLQPKNTFFAGNVKPGADSNLHLSGGVAIPYFYSLGNQSTVPFVKFQGSGGTQKTFTWGELIEVKPNEQVQVFNASYMPGDIQIQSGHDFCNKPQRISVPIETDLNPLNLVVDPDTGNYTITPGTIINPIYPCDCRNALKAFLSVDWFTGVASSGTGPNRNSVFIVGQNQQHTFIPEALFLPPLESPLFFNSGKKYWQRIGLPSLTQLDLIPLGYNSNAHSPDPMTLLDQAFWQINCSTDDPTVIGELRPLFFYVLEY